MSESINRTDLLLAGVTLIDPVMVPHGFRFEVRQSGKGSGGPFAWGEYVRGDRRLELHFRWSLGMVTYHLADLSAEHEEYMSALGVEVGHTQYPGFADDPLDGFRHLVEDLNRFGDDFLSGDGHVLRAAARAAEARRAERSLLLMAQAVGDDGKREQARRSFRRNAYAEVVSLLEDLRYPELLTTSERRMLELAGERLAD